MNRALLFQPSCLGSRNPPRTSDLATPRKNRTLPPAVFLAWTFFPVLSRSTAAVFAVRAAPIRYTVSAIFVGCRALNTAVMRGKRYGGNQVPGS